jgi:hypothetical protein
MTVYSLGQDDMPTCPTHGIRIITDYFVAEDGLTYERGKCPLCKRTYHFYVEEEKEFSDQKLTT